MYNNEELRDIIVQGKSSDLWKALTQIFEAEKEDLAEKVDDLDNFTDEQRKQMIAQKNFLKWIIQTPERIEEKPVEDKKESDDPYDN